MSTSIIKRSVVIAGHATSVSLETEFWDTLKEIAFEKNMSIAALIRQIDHEFNLPDRRNLSSILRIYILKYLKNFSEKK